MSPIKMLKKSDVDHFKNEVGRIFMFSSVSWKKKMLKLRGWKGGEPRKNPSSLQVYLLFVQGCYWDSSHDKAGEIEKD